VGDTVRASTGVSLRRTGAGEYELSSDVDVAVALPGGAMETSTDRQTWKPAATKAANGMVEATFTRATWRRTAFSGCGSNSEKTPGVFRESWQMP